MSSETVYLAALICGIANSGRVGFVAQLQGRGGAVGSGYGVRGG